MRSPKAYCILLGCLALAACTTPAPKVVTQLQNVRVHVPAALLTDPSPPPPPQINTASAVSQWLVRLWADDVNKTNQIAAIQKLDP